MFCKSCGNEISDGAKFCRYCGSKMENTAVNTEPMPSAGQSDSGIKTAKSDKPASAGKGKKISPYACPVCGNLKYDSVHGRNLRRCKSCGKVFRTVVEVGVEIDLYRKRIALLFILTMIIVTLIIAVIYSNMLSCGPSEYTTYQEYQQKLAAEAARRSRIIWFAVISVSAAITSIVFFIINIVRLTVKLSEKKLLTEQFKARVDVTKLKECPFCETKLLPEDRFCRKCKIKY